MKRIKLTILIAASLALLLNFACTDLDTRPESSLLTKTQLEEIYEREPDRLASQVAGIMSSIATPISYSESQKDWGYPIICAMNESNGPDFINEDTGYDWLSGESLYEDKHDNSWHAALPWFYFYRQIKQANDLINLIGENPEDEQYQQYLGMAYAFRAFDYISLASHYQLKYVGNEDAPSVPLVLHNTPLEQLGNNPRASQREVYAQILADCDKAIALLKGKSRSKVTEPDESIAYGLRARANLLMERWAEAAADAKMARAGYKPYSMTDVSKPSFIKADAWMWGIIYTPDMVVDNLYSWVGHMSTFTSYGYNTVGVFKRINRLLYDQIPYTDVRKGWWLDENKETPNLDGMLWDGYDALLYLTHPKIMAAPTYTQVKWGQYGGLGGLPNAGDWPLMRVEEMYLIEAEATGRIDEAAGKALLEDFVQNYRDPQYDISKSPRAFVEEVWFQRRVELWGEGFSLFDIIRLGKPMVRSHGASDNDYFSGSYAPLQFNVPANDPILLNQILKTEMETNPAVVQNQKGKTPSSGDNLDLRDGVTDFAPVSAPVVSVEGVKLNVTKDTIALGDSLQLVATISPAKASNKDVTWKSSAEAVASVDTTGKVKALTVGKATITVTTVDGNKTATCEIVVKDTATTPVAPTTYAIRIAEGIENGKVTVEPTEAAADSIVTITVTPADGYQLKARSLKAYKKGEPATEVSINAENKFTMPAYEVEVTAEFELIPPTTYAINIGTFSNGTVTSNPATEAAEGATVTLTVAPETGYQLTANSLKVNNGAVAVTATGNANEYTFQMPAEAVTVTAAFESTTP